MRPKKTELVRACWVGIIWTLCETLTQVFFFSMFSYDLSSIPSRYAVKAILIMVLHSLNYMNVPASFFFSVTSSLHHLQSMIDSWLTTWDFSHHILPLLYEPGNLQIKTIYRLPLEVYKCICSGLDSLLKLRFKRTQRKRKRKLTISIKTRELCRKLMRIENLIKEGRVIGGVKVVELDWRRLEAFNKVPITEKPAPYTSASLGVFYFI